jgi:hypothetical protein
MLFTVRILLSEVPSDWGWNGVVRVFQTSRKLQTSSTIFADRFFPVHGEVSRVRYDLESTHQTPFLQQFLLSDSLGGTLPTIL